MKPAHIYYYLAWLIASALMLGSFYLSEVHHLEPCTLCWYQRMAIFPLTILLAIALYKNYLGIFIYAIPFAILGFLISSTQILLQEFPHLPLIHACSSQISCASKHILFWGWVTPPMLAGLGSIVITTLLWRGNSLRKQ